MIKLNWMLILVIIVLLVFLYINNSEHFGATDIINPEAVRNISSVYNTDNLTATNITASNTLTIPGKNKITLSATDGKSLCIGDTCITEDHLKMLNGTKEIALKNKSTGWWIGKQYGGYIKSLSNSSPRDKNGEGADDTGAFYITNF